MSSDDTQTLFRSSSEGTRRPSRLLERGATVGRFVVLHSVGRGGSGEVYAAYDPQLERKVAIKLLHSGPDPDALVHEAQACRERRKLSSYATMRAASTASSATPTARC